MFASSIIPADCAEVVSQKNFRRCLVFSVFPDPLSPDMMIDWGISNMRTFLKALSAVRVRWSSLALNLLNVLSYGKLFHSPMAYTCGGNAPNETPWYFVTILDEYNSSITSFGFTAISISEIYVCWEINHHSSWIISLEICHLQVKFQYQQII